MKNGERRGEKKRGKKMLKQIRKFNRVHLFLLFLFRSVSAYLNTKMSSYSLSSVSSTLEGKNHREKKGEHSSMLKERDPNKSKLGLLKCSSVGYLCDNDGKCDAQDNTDPDREVS